MAAALPEEVERALTCAFDAWGHGHGPVGRSKLRERLAMLERFADALDERTEGFAFWHARETGIPLSTARMFAAGLGDIAREIAEAARAVPGEVDLSTADRRILLQRLPWGPAALYAPWNAAAFLAVTKVGYAIAAGCPGILKPSEYTPGTTGLMVEALQESDLHAGAAQVLCGGVDVGAKLAGDSRIRMINYTGGTAGGRAVAAAASDRMIALQLELSASNPAIVTRDADLELAAGELARAALVLNGQWCEAPRRVLVDEEVHETLVEQLIEHLSAPRMGPALDPGTELGPLAHRRQHETVRDAVRTLADVGELRVTHETLPERGYFMSPTVVSGLPLGAVRQEIFGPVLPVSPFGDIDEALAAANSLDDGLAGYVFSGDRDEAISLGSRVHAGEVRVGGARLLDLTTGSAQSFWGTSGVGGHGRVPVLDAHLGTRIIGEEDLDLPI